MKGEQYCRMLNTANPSYLYGMKIILYLCQSQRCGVNNHDDDENIDETYGINVQFQESDEEEIGKWNF